MALEELFSDFDAKIKAFGQPGAAPAPKVNPDLVAKTAAAGGFTPPTPPIGTPAERFAAYQAAQAPPPAPGTASPGVRFEAWQAAQRAATPPPFSVPPAAAATGAGAAPAAAVAETVTPAAGGFGAKIATQLPTLSKAAGPLATAVVPALEAKGVYDVATDPNASGTDVATQAALGISRAAGATAGGRLGLMAPLPGWGRLAAGALGGLVGYAAPGFAMRMAGGEVPSEKLAMQAAVGNGSVDRTPEGGIPTPATATAVAPPSASVEAAMNGDVAGSVGMQRGYGAVPINPRTSLPYSSAVVPRLAGDNVKDIIDFIGVQAPRYVTARGAENAFQKQVASNNTVRVQEMKDTAAEKRLRMTELMKPVTLTGQSGGQAVIIPGNNTLYSMDASGKVTTGRVGGALPQFSQQSVKAMVAKIKAENPTALPVQIRQSVEAAYGKDNVIPPDWLK